MKLDATTAAVEASKEVVKICTQYAQKGTGLINIFIASSASRSRWRSSTRSSSSATSSAWPSSASSRPHLQWPTPAALGTTPRRSSRSTLKMKNTPLHAATVVGDTVGDPFQGHVVRLAQPRSSSSTTLFGLLAVEIAVNMPPGQKHLLGGIIFVIALVFVYRSFLAACASRWKARRAEPPSLRNSQERALRPALFFCAPHPGTCHPISDM